MNSENIVLIAIVVMTTIAAIISIIVIKNEKKKNAIKRSIKENCTPRRGLIKDILIEAKGQHDKRYLSLYLIVEDNLNKKNYISYGEYDYTSNSIIIMRYPNGNFKYEITISGNKIDIGDEVNIYVNREIEIIKTASKNINLKNLPRRYKGRKEGLSLDSILYMENDEIANIAMEPAEYDDAEIVLYEGFIDTNLYE